jgi:hypothetical protein
MVTRNLFFGEKLTLFRLPDFLFDCMPFNISDYILGLTLESLQELSPNK